MKSVLEQSEKKQRTIIGQYEVVRKSGHANMFDMKNVNKIAEMYGFKALVSMTKDSKDYSTILQNYSVLMKKFNL
jgi:hypothetical protein